MKSERWQSCTEIFHQAVAQPPEQRAAILERRCCGDEALRRRVESLLKYHDASGDFISEPAFARAPEFLVDDPEALIGQHLGSYRVDAVAGVGGMGVVYLAYDERLGRKVALKLLPPAITLNEGELERLRNEARIASALNHPNIVTVHEIGQVDSTPFVATEFVEGATLRERMSQSSLPPDEAIDIAIQVASALEVAHRAGIVHRDIKPENIILRPDGYVKVLDFGIATVTPQGNSAAELSEAIKEKRFFGTAHYVSPEQARDETVDDRTDFWSLGVVLYEMLAGRAPFEGATPAEVIAAVLRTDPPPLKEHAPKPPPALQSVVARCLQKNPANRYQTATEMLPALRAIKKAMAENRPNRRARLLVLAASAALLLGAALLSSRRGSQPNPAAVPEKSIAVLPFENLSSDSDSALLTAGLHDGVVTSLAKIKDFKVIARDSVMSYRGAAAGAGKLREIGAALGVANLLQTSVRRSDQRLAVDVALIDAPSQEQKWAHHYECSLGEAARLPGKLAMDLARELQATVSPSEAAAAVTEPTENADAYLLYLRARESKTVDAGPERLQAALRLCQQAVDLDPNFALARAHLSICASFLFFHQEERGEWKLKARAEAEAALRLRPDLGEAWLARAHCSFWGDREYDRALQELGRAAELLPNSLEVCMTAALIYKRQLRYRERIAALQRAEALDPMNRGALVYLFHTFRCLRAWPEAIRAFDRFVALAGDGEKPPGWRWRRASDEFRLTGDIGALKKAIAAEPADESAGWLDLARYETAMLERDYAEAARALAVVPATTFSDAPVDLARNSRAFDEALLAVATRSSSRQEKLVLARREIVAEMGPGEAAAAWFGPDLALLDAFLGRKDDALCEANHVVELYHDGPGGIEQNIASSVLAMVYAQTGEPEKAITLIEHLLTVPCELQTGRVYNLTLTDLKWRWQWDPLRRHPRFQRILAGPEPVTVF